MSEEQILVGLLVQFENIFTKNKKKIEGIRKALKK